MDLGLKYLGFRLNPNSYIKGDWMWLLAKIKKRIPGWTHRWMSRVGRLILIKSVLQSIPVYWMSLLWILKRILEKITVKTKQSLAQSAPVAMPKTCLFIITKMDL